MASLSLHMWLPLLLLLFPFIFLLKKKLNSKHLPPGPPGLPIIGNLHQLGTLPPSSLWQLSKKYGPVMLLQLGQIPTVIISSAEAAKELIKTNDLNSCSRPCSAATGRLSYNFLDISFAPYGDYWREMRKICVLELFSAKRVQSFQSIREEEVGFLIDPILKPSLKSSSPVDLSEKTLSLTANVICRAAFGKSFQERGFNHDRFQEAIHEAFAMLGSFPATDFFPHVGWIVDRLTGLHTTLERVFQEFDEFYQKIIDDHIRMGKADPGHEDVIDVLLDLERHRTASGGIQISRNHIKAILMDIFLAGVDTGAVVMVWAMTELVRNPRVMRKAQEEIRSLIGEKIKVSESDTDKFIYLKSVLKETMRLHPPVPLLLPREAISQFNINDYEIHPKTRIQVNVWAIGKDPKIWKNPEEFIPERFIDNSIDFRGQNYEFLPFGGGRRSCPGITMGLALVELALANLLFCFDWELPYNMKEADINMEEKFGLTNHKKEALMLVPIKYHHLLYNKE
ncbi:hypothetical protein JCGZ_11122 [Jatropha curcas]|uniref:Cytochrome P450 n=1 Tax=Jatropha curcas TaxID=180498 RepID=A0A067KEL9_JATCU|nr:hypothetical protein JCGZ_11122 [Jatropha curcas]